MLITTDLPQVLTLNVIYTYFRISVFEIFLTVGFVCCCVGVQINCGTGVLSVFSSSSTGMSSNAPPPPTLEFDGWTSQCNAPQAGGVFDTRTAAPSSASTPSLSNSGVAPRSAPPMPLAYTTVPQLLPPSHETATTSAVLSPADTTTVSPEGSSSKQHYNTGRWSAAEVEAYEYAVNKQGYDVKKIQKFIPTRSYEQIRKHIVNVKKRCKPPSQPEVSPPSEPVQSSVLQNVLDDYLPVPKLTGKPLFSLNSSHTSRHDSTSPLQQLPDLATTRRLMMGVYGREEQHACLIPCRILSYLSPTALSRVCCASRSLSFVASTAAVLAIVSMWRRSKQLRLSGRFCNAILSCISCCKHTETLHVMYTSMMSMAEVALQAALKQVGNGNSAAAKWLSSPGGVVTSAAASGSGPHVVKFIRLHGDPKFSCLPCPVRAQLIRAGAARVTLYNSLLNEFHNECGRELVRECNKSKVNMLLVTALLNTGADPNTITGQSSCLTPLQAMLIAQQTEFVMHLIQAGADPMVKTSAGESTVMLAVTNGCNIQAINLLIQSIHQRVGAAGVAAVLNDVGNVHNKTVLDVLKGVKRTSNNSVRKSELADLIVCLGGQTTAAVGQSAAGRTSTASRSQRTETMPPPANVQSTAQPTPRKQKRRSAAANKAAAARKYRQLMCEDGAYAKHYVKRRRTPRSSPSNRSPTRSPETAEATAQPPIPMQTQTPQTIVQPAAQPPPQLTAQPTGQPASFTSGVFPQADSSGLQQPLLLQMADQTDFQFNISSEQQVPAPIPQAPLQLVAVPASQLSTMAAATAPALAEHLTQQ